MSKLGIITALPIEAYSLSRRRFTVRQTEALGHDIWLYISGIGAHNACVGMQQLADLGIKNIINWGVVAALDFSGHSGDLQLPTRITDGVNTLLIDTEWHRSVCVKLRSKWHGRLHTGMLASSAQPLQTTKQKYILNQATHALSADMEAYALAAMAIRLDIEFLAIKAVADDAHTVLPDCVIKHTNEYGRPRWTHFIREVMCRPRQILELYALSLCFRRAMQGLCFAREELLRHRFYVVPR